MSTAIACVVVVVSFFVLQGAGFFDPNLSGDGRSLVRGLGWVGLMVAAPLLGILEVSRRRSKNGAIGESEAVEGAEVSSTS